MVEGGGGGFPHICRVNRSYKQSMGVGAIYFYFLKQIRMLSIPSAMQSTSRAKVVPLLFNNRGCSTIFPGVYHAIVI